MLNPLKRFMLCESGLEIVEWAIVGGVIAGGAAALLFAIGLDVSRGLTSLHAETSVIPGQPVLLVNLEESARQSPQAGYLEWREQITGLLE